MEAPRSPTARQSDRAALSVEEDCVTEQTNVIDCLREQFARLHGRLDDMARWQDETGRRLVAIERHIAGVRRDAVTP